MNNFTVYTVSTSQGKVVQVGSYSSRRGHTIAKHAVKPGQVLKLVAENISQPEAVTLANTLKRAAGLLAYQLRPKVARARATFAAQVEPESPNRFIEAWEWALPCK